ncbi:hypothetical protein BGX31_011654 [Mortierella sp. GBA43]|nr:hypothetical protein BGX31_011654 [Mortierella sp. GBA43]
MNLAKAIVNPLDLPELRAAIGYYLTLRDLAQCLRVCKSWHTTFLPLVWSTIIIKDNQRYPTVEAFSRHCCFVEDLTYTTELCHEYISMHCSNLVSLTINHTSDTSPVNIDQYQRLHRLSIQGPLRIPHTKLAVWKPVHHLHTLSILELDMLRIDPTDNTAFWDMCIRLKSLTMKFVYITELPDRTMTFDQLETLSLRLQSKIQFERHLDWFAQCPNLISLAWNPWRDQQSEGLDALAARLAEGAWPKLCRLQLRGNELEDERLSRIINGMKTVESLTDIGHGFGPFSLIALRSHFHTLRILDIEASSFSTSSMIPEILSSCPQLRTLILGDVYSDSIVQGDPWVCQHSLKAFSARIIITSKQDQVDDQQRILERISELGNLEKLQLLEPLAMHTTGLDLRLGKGLELLSTLKMLRILSLNASNQRLSVADVKWMIAHWKDLTRVTVKWNPDDSGELGEMFLTAGIRYEGRL